MGVSWEESGFCGQTGETDVIRMELAGASHGLRATGTEQLPGTANYFIGNDPKKWRSNLPTFAKVKYTGVYPGVDLVYYGKQRQLEYDFVVAPGSRAAQIRLRFAGTTKLKLKLNSDGDLQALAKNGQIAFHKPVAYQDIGGERHPIDGRFRLLNKSTVEFALGVYDHTNTVVIRR